MIKSHVSISRHVYSVFQNIKTNWLSWSDTIVLGNSCSLNIFLMKTLATSIVLRILREIIYYIFINLSTIIIICLYSLLKNRFITKLIKISCYLYIKIDNDWSTSCFFACHDFSCAQIEQNWIYFHTKSCIIS